MNSSESEERVFNIPLPVLEATMEKIQFDIMELARQEEIIGARRVILMNQLAICFTQLSAKLKKELSRGYPE